MDSWISVSDIGRTDMKRSIPIIVAGLLVLSGCQGILGGGADAATTETETDSLPVYTVQEPDPRWNLAIFYENVTFEEGEPSSEVSRQRGTSTVSYMG